MFFYFLKDVDVNYQKVYGNLFFYWNKVRKMSTLNSLIHTVHDMEKAGMNVDKLKDVIRQMKEGTYVSKRKEKREK